MANQKKIAVAERKKLQFRTTEAMDFDPPPTILHNQDVDHYLEKHHDPLPLGIITEWCDPNMNFRDLTLEEYTSIPRCWHLGCIFPFLLLSTKFWLITASLLPS